MLKEKTKIKTENKHDVLAMWGQNDQTLGGLVNEDAMAIGMRNLSDMKTETVLYRDIYSTLQ